jgi:hypothetical protein
LRARSGVDALARATGAASLFGLSSGAITALQAALVLPAIRRVAVYEPPLSVNYSTPTSWVARYEREVAAGRLGSAAITAIRGTRTAPPVLRLVPRALLEVPLNRAARANANSSRVRSGGQLPSRCGTWLRWTGSGSRSLAPATYWTGSTGRILAGCGRHGQPRGSGRGGAAPEPGQELRIGFDATISVAHKPAACRRWPAARSPRSATGGAARGSQLIRSACRIWLRIDRSWRWAAQIPFGFDRLHAAFV